MALFQSTFWKYPKQSRHFKGNASCMIQTRCFWWKETKGETSSEKNDENIEVLNSNAVISQDGDGVPRYPTVIALPLERRPIFPTGVLPYRLKHPTLIESITSAVKEGHPYVGLFLRKHDLDKFSRFEEDAVLSQQDVIKKASEIHQVGVFAQIHNLFHADDGAHMMLLAHRRIRLKTVVTYNPTLTCHIDHLQPKPFDINSDEIKAYTNEVLSSLREISKTNSLLREHMNISLQRHNIGNPGRLADLAASITTSDPLELQDILETLDVPERMNKCLVLLKKEIELGKIQQEINKQVEEKISENQRKYFLMEQLKSIKKELGMQRDEKDAIITDFQEKIKDLVIPKEVQNVIDEELRKLAILEVQSSEYNVTRSYLDWLTCIPWGKFTEDNLDLSRAKQVLDEDHYGLDDVKDRILEFIAVGKLRGSVHGKIICLAGPPGVGKTSIGRSIARALNREFYRFSVGGITDVAEIKGHRRTYVGAMPGKLIQCLKSTQSQNPLVLIDEIDKISRGHGDPASALLELLDPSQNSSFRDHYLDVPTDLSKVLFVCTANVLDTIPGPLLDRMEVINLSGYITDEKIAIANQYLIPKAMKETGIVENQLSVSNDAIENLIRWYCREAGVRSLEKHIEKLLRKVAFRIIGKGESHVDVTKDNLKEFVGDPIFTSDRLYDSTPDGVVMGLAWTATGGSALYIEAVSVKKKENQGSMLTTGRMGDVMKESSRIALSFAQIFLNQQDPSNPFFEKNELHMHVPEGATPKDGPSAGCTMVTALLSLAMNKPVIPNFAMTGEITLTGKILPVGGIKEKVIAAKRARVSTIVLPLANKKDWDSLPPNVQSDLNVYFADHYSDVYRVAFP